MTQIDVGTAIALSIVTLGIYGNVAFFECARQYQALAPGVGKNFDAYFWLYIGLILPVLFFAIVFFPLALLLMVGQVVAGYLALGEMLEARTAVVARHGLSLQLTSPDTLKGYWLFGNFLVFFMCAGIIPLIIQAMKLFEDHNQITRSLAQR